MTTCCSIREYVPYQYTKAQANAVCDAFKSPDRSLCCRIGSAAFHALAVLVCALVDTVISACRWVYIHIVPAQADPDPRVSDLARERISSSRLASESGLPQGSGTASAILEQIPPTLPLGTVTDPSIRMPPLASEPAPLPPVEEDLGMGTPTWYCTRDLGGKEVYSLCRLPPFHFHNAPEFQITNNGLAHEKFTLSNAVRLLCSGKIVKEEWDLEEYPAIRFDCNALNALLTSPHLKHSICEHSLHCSGSAPVNLDPSLRKDYQIHERATSYRFIYPVQLDPDKSVEFIKQLMENRDIPAFLKGLLLIGGYAYYDTDSNLVQVKSFSASSDATEILPTGKALDLRAIGFPPALLADFKRGIEMTSGSGDFAGLKNALSPYANSITAPVLKHLKYFAYIPQSLYSANPKMMAAAPLGGFLYQTHDGEYQFVPIGGDFIKPPERHVDLALTAEERQQNDKQLLFASIFYQTDSGIVSMAGIEGLVPGGFIESLEKGVQFTLREPGVTYIIQATVGREIQISKTPISVSAPKQEIIGRITEQGVIDRCSNVPLFRQLLDEVLPYLMSKMVKVSEGRISTFRESITFAPQRHLARLFNVLGTYGSLTIDYLDLAVRRYIAIDASGLSRDYLAAVIKESVSHSILFEQVRDPDGPEDGLYGLNKSFNISNEEQVSRLEQIAVARAERNMLEQLAVVFSWVINQNGAYPVGRLFSSSFFKYLHFCLNHNGPLTNEILLPLYVACNPSIKAAVECLMKVTAPQMWTAEIESLRNFLTYTLEIKELADIGADDNLTMEKQQEAAYKVICEKWRTLQSQAQQAISTQLKDTILPPYKLIADSMRPHMHRIMSSGAVLGLAIQGESDMNKIAAAISYLGYRHSVQQKVRWIQDWIRSKQTPRKEIDDFITAATGSSLLGQEQGITVNGMAVIAPNAFPVYHTCFRSVDMPFGQALDSGQGKHSTRESFIKSFKIGIAAALAAPNGFTMG